MHEVMLIFIREGEERYIVKIYDVTTFAPLLFSGFTRLLLHIIL